jgi:5-hydroxyisourate hydrolase
MSQLTTHILDTTKGRPAKDVPVTLYGLQDNEWTYMAKGVTNQDGRVTDLLPADRLLEPGDYKLNFDTSSYFEQQAVKSFYPFVEIVFTIDSSDHYHVPLLLNPFGYSTYRGS